MNELEEEVQELRNINEQLMERIAQMTEEKETDPNQQIQMNEEQKLIQEEKRLIQILESSSPSKKYMNIITSTGGVNTHRNNYRASQKHLLPPLESRGSNEDLRAGHRNSNTNSRSRKKTTLRASYDGAEITIEQAQTAKTFNTNSAQNIRDHTPSKLENALDNIHKFYPYTKQIQAFKVRKSRQKYVDWAEAETNNSFSPKYIKKQWDFSVMIGLPEIRRKYMSTKRSQKEEVYENNWIQAKVGEGNS